MTTNNHVVKPRSQGMLTMCGRSTANVSKLLSAKRASELTNQECIDQQICDDCMKELSAVLARAS